MNTFNCKRQPLNSPRPQLPNSTVIKEVTQAEKSLDFTNLDMILKCIMGEP